MLSVEYFENLDKFDFIFGRCFRVLIRGPSGFFKKMKVSCRMRMKREKLTSKEDTRVEVKYGRR
jgi:hypothetical protein